MKKKLLVTYTISIKKPYILILKKILYTVIYITYILGLDYIVNKGYFHAPQEDK